MSFMQGASTAAWMAQQSELATVLPYVGAARYQSRFARPCAGTIGTIVERTSW